MGQIYFQRLTVISTCLLVLLGNVQANWRIEIAKLKQVNDNLQKEHLVLKAELQDLKKTVLSLQSSVERIMNEQLTTTPATDIFAIPDEGDQTVILLATLHSVDKINMVTNESTSILEGLGKATGVDYIYGADLVFWSDAGNKEIYSGNVTTGRSRKQVITTNIFHPEGIAVDWIYGNIYWTDSLVDFIEVCDLHGTIRKTLFDTGLDEPRPIAVDPIDGWMFWADWGNASKIERAGMDGCCRELIITTDIGYPNGLSLDYAYKRIYWVDAKLGTLSTANYDGSERRTIIDNSDVIHFSFGMDVFEDSVYWSDWTTKAIHSANKLTGQNITTVLTGESIPMGLRVYHPLRQPEGENYCKSLSEYCSHFCFPTPRITS